MFALFLLVASTHFAALLSPGPDFFLLLRAALIKGRRHADGCAAGIALANLMSMLLVLLALSLLSGESGWLWQALQLLGGGYFLWLGGQALLAWRQVQLPQGDEATVRGRWREGLVEGLLASSLNPKLPIFYAGLFGMLRTAALPEWALCLSMLWMTGVVLAWDMGLVRLLGYPRWRARLAQHVRLLDRVCGVLLMLLGAGLVLGAFWR